MLYHGPMYDAPEILLQEIEAGEDSFLDFKEIVFEGRRPRVLSNGRSAEGRAGVRIAKDLSCFANAEGGVIVFGVRDDGERVGIAGEGMDELQEWLVNVAQNNTGRRDEPAYSLRALQEGVVNALVHRDYSIAGSQVRVFLFSDRIMISSPGHLPNSLTPEDLYAGCQPVRRNQMLAGFLRDYTSPLTERSYMEARGEGFLKLVRECEAIGAPRPRLTTVGDSLCLEIFAAYPVTGGREAAEPVGRIKS